MGVTTQTCARLTHHHINTTIRANPTLINMLSTITKLITSNVAISIRTFAVTPAFAKAAVSSTATQGIKDLRKQLKKEKLVLSELQTKLKKKLASAQEKAKKAKAAESEKKLLAKALKPYRKLTAFNVYILETCTGMTNFSETSKAWAELPIYEQDEYARKAEELNEENIKIWTPKPTGPPNGYARFIKENWVDKGNFADSSKEVASKWNNLSQEERKAYEPAKELLDSYRKELAAWKTYRLNLFKEKSAAKK